MHGYIVGCMVVHSEFQRSCCELLYLQRDSVVGGSTSRELRGIKNIVHDSCGYHPSMMYIVFNKKLQIRLRHIMWTYKNWSIQLYFDIGEIYAVSLFQKVHMVPDLWWVDPFMEGIVQMYPNTSKSSQHIYNLLVLYKDQVYLDLDWY